MAALTKRQRLIIIRLSKVATAVPLVTNPMAVRGLAVMNQDMQNVRPYVGYAFMAIIQEEWTEAEHLLTEAEAWIETRKAADWK
ncbi:MAG TPA: hypothetical protein VGK74_02875 [Symbiobacteriaceae bacterium]